MNSSTVLFTPICNLSRISTFEQTEGINVIQILLMYIHVLKNANMSESIGYICLSHLFASLFIYKMMKACLSRPSSDDHYVHVEIMLWKTKVLNT
jgi:hypothetical protein